MGKRGCWDDEKDDKWTKDSQKMVRITFVLSNRINLMFR